MDWICQVVCIICLLVGGSSVYNGKQDKNEQLQKAGYIFLIIGIFLFLIWMNNFKNS